MSELKEYFKDNDMQWDLEHFDEYSESDKEHWRNTLGFKRWKAVKELRQAVEDELMPYFEKPLRMAFETLKGKQ